jgi:hypothetical protein
MSGAPLTAATGVITDGSGPREDYLASSNCAWIVRPSPAAAAATAAAAAAEVEGPKSPRPTRAPDTDGRGITLVFEQFKTVFDDDFLFITDASEETTAAAAPTTANSSARPAAAAPELALYSGKLPTPMAVRFDGVSALRLNFVTRGDNRDKGFVVRYIADGTCYNDCDGGRGSSAAAGTGFRGGVSGTGAEAGKGVCRQSLCVCEDGWTGADCSIRLEPLGGDGYAVSGSVSVGETKYYRVTVPAFPPNLMLKVGAPSRKCGWDGRNLPGLKAHAWFLFSLDPPLTWEPTIIPERERCDDLMSDVARGRAL